MALKAKKTEHGGAKHGKGPITKREAKEGSRKARRIADRKEEEDYAKGRWRAAFSGCSCQYVTDKGINGLPAQCPKHGGYKWIMSVFETEGPLGLRPGRKWRT